MEKNEDEIFYKISEEKLESTINKFIENIKNKRRN